MSVPQHSGFGMLLKAAIPPGNGGMAPGQGKRLATFHFQLQGSDSITTLLVSSIARGLVSPCLRIY